MSVGSFFFYQFCFNSAADIFVQFLKINIRNLSFRRLAKQLGTDLWVVLLRHIVGRHIVVIQTFGRQSVDCITLGKSERGNLLMFFFFLILDSSFCWRLSALKKRERKNRQRRLKELWHTTWSSTYVTNLNRIYCFQKPAERAITNSDYKANSAPLFSKLRILDIYKINTFGTAKLMFCYRKNLLLPLFFNLFFY